MVSSPHVSERPSPLSAVLVTRRDLTLRPSCSNLTRIPSQHKHQYSPFNVIIARKRGAMVSAQQFRRS